MPDDLRNEKPIALDRELPADRTAVTPVLPGVTESSRRRAFRLTAIILLAVVAVFAGWRVFSQHMVKVMMAQPLPPTPITAAVAESASVPKYLSGIGTLQAVRQVTVAPEVGGR